MVLSSYVGATVRRKEDPRLITGSSTYVDDLQLPGMVSAIFVRSPYAHANINGIDATAALAMPGVHGVYSALDLKKVLKASYPTQQGEVPDDPTEHPEEVTIPVPLILPLAEGRVRYVGDPVAVVVADTAAQAIDAAQLVEVDYEPLEAVVDPYKAMEPGAPQLYEENPGNISVIEEIKTGDPDGAMASAKYKISAKIRSPRCHPMPLEPRGVVAQPDPMLQGITFWSSTQAPHWNRNSIAEALGIPQSQVRCIAPEVGGGFGCKIGAYPEDFVISGLALLLKRPVKWMESRSENFLATNHGRNQWSEFEAGCDETGKVVAVKARVVLDSGAYPKALDLAWCTWVMSTGPYDIQNLDYKVTGVYTNTMANGAYRGAGRPEATFYIERVMDMLADESGIDPAEIRRANFIQPEQFPFTTLTGEHYDTGEYEKPLNKAIEVLGYGDLLKEQERLRGEGRYLGIGMAAYVEICGFGPYDSSKVRVEPSGALSIFTGVSPHWSGAGDDLRPDRGRLPRRGVRQHRRHHGDTATRPRATARWARAGSRSAGRRS
jgi:CO/xanthine dehydrogenase Mo-binding subunit